MSEDAVRETAAGSETRGVASPEFFFLLQRIDRLDEKLSARMEQTNVRIDQLEAKLGARIDQTNARIDQINTRTDQLEAKLGAKIEQAETSLRQEISAFKSAVWTAAGAIIAAFGVVVAVLLALRR
ncbi:MAG: hypothetical protein ACPLTR_10155 [Thermacetogeniaceae bacterium]